MPDIFIASTIPALQPVRARVVARLQAHGYVVVSETPDLTRFSDRKRLIDSSVLFLAILPPAGARLPMGDEDDTNPLLLDELKYAGSILLDCLVYLANWDFRGLERLRPPAPVVVSPPRIPHLIDPPKPGPPNRLSVDYWIQQLRALGDAKTPEQQYKAALADYNNKRSEKKRLRPKVKQWQTAEQARRQVEAGNIYQRKRERHDAQKAAAEELERERENYRYHRFSSTDALLKLLDDDLAALETAGYLPATKHRQTLLQRWAQTTKEQRRAIQEAIDAAHTQLPLSPAEALLADFYALQWHEQVRRLAEAVADRAAAIAREFEFPEVRAETTPYSSLPVDCDTAPYQLIEVELREWVVAAEDSVARIKKWVNQNEEAEKEKKRRDLNRDAQQALERYAVFKKQVVGWLKQIEALHQALREAAYGKCLLLAGRSGSGKSHFVARLLQQHGQPVGEFTPYYLYLASDACLAANPTQPSVEAVLLKAARFTDLASVSGPRWHSFAEFAAFVAQLPAAKLVIVLDDLDVWLTRCGLGLPDLQCFIAQHTHWHHLSWILCVREHQLHRVANELSQGFWPKYAPAYDGATSGWLDLGLLNKDAEVWRAIVLGELGAAKSKYLEKTVAELSEQTRQLIELPFIARIFAWFLQAGRTAPELRNLNYIEFVEEYWQRRTVKLLQESRGADGLAAPEGLGTKVALYWRAIYLISGLIAEQANVELGAINLAERLRQADVEPTIGFSESADAIVAALAACGLLAAPNDPADIGRFGHLVWPGGFLPLWYWKIGEYLLEVLRDDQMPLRLSRAEIARKVRAHFDIEELHDLCFELGVEYDDLEGQGRMSKVRELVMELDRQRNLGALLAIARQKRPAVDWPSPAGGEAQAEVDAWLRYRFEKRWSAEDRQDVLPEVLEFFLLLLDQAKDEWRRKVLIQILSGSIRLFPPYQAQVWLAAAKASGAFQYGLADWLLKKREHHQHVAEGSLPQFLYFLKYAAASDGESTGLTCVARLQLIRPFYQAIRKDEYLCDALSAMLAAGDPYDAAQALAHLDGIEPHLDETCWWVDSGILAGWAYSKLETLAARLEPGPGRDDHLARVHRLMLAFLGEVAHIRWAPVEKDAFWHKHWIKLVGVHSHKFAPDVSLEGLEWLAESGWLSLVEEPGAIDKVVEAKLTVSCGEWYRWQDTSREEKERYQAAARAWARPESSVGRKRVAFYLCKHSVASEGPGADQLVDEELWAIVQQLKEDKNPIIKKIIKSKAVRIWMEKQER